MIRFPIEFDNEPTALVPCGCVYYVKSDITRYCKQHERRNLLAGAVAIVGIVVLLITAFALLETQS